MNEFDGKKENSTDFSNFFEEQHKTPLTGEIDSSIKQNGIAKLIKGKFLMYLIIFAVFAFFFTMVYIFWIGGVANTSEKEFNAFKNRPQFLPDQFSK